MTRQKGFSKRSYLGREVTGKIRISLTKSVIDFPQPQLPIISFWYREDIFYLTIQPLAFKKEKGHSDLFASTIFQASLTQNSQYARVVYLEWHILNSSFNTFFTLLQKLSIFSFRQGP